MQLVRCDSCGARALVAASQCPRCSNPFYLRNAKGTVALGHCRACDTYYPRSRGGCKWCGTRLQSFPGVLIVVAGVIAAACIIALGVWKYRVNAS